MRAQDSFTKLTPTVIALAAAAVCSISGTINAVAEPLPAAPSADQLTGSLNTIFDSGASDSVRAANLEAGQRGIPLANRAAATFDQFRSMVSWHVENPALDGDHLNSQLAISAAGLGARTYSITWRDRDGRWTLSNASFCAMTKEVVPDCVL